MRGAGCSLCLALLFAAPGAGAQPSPAPPAVPFDALWSDVLARSPEARASETLMLAEQLSARRFARHWWPRFSLEGRGFATDGPAGSFLGLLAQRAIRPPDLSPDALNEPPGRLFGQAALRADWLLYEGGAGAARVEGASLTARQRELEHQAVVARSYVTTAMLYGRALALGEHREANREVAGTLAGLIDAYRVGTPENPLGYSGLLGLQGLANRAGATLRVDAARREAALASLTSLSGRDEPWEPSPQPLREFNQRHLVLPEESLESPGTLALESEAAAAETAGTTERARLLPGAGLFGELAGGAGARDLALAAAGGAFVSWRFDAVDAGAQEEAELRAQSARARARAERERGQADAAGGRGELAALEEALERLERNERLLEEQVRVARGLFQSGVINALQLVEVLSRRLDLLDQLLETRLALLEAYGRVALSGRLQVPGGPGGK